MFKKRLKNLRESKGWTQEELGKKLHLGKSSISMYEKGDRVPSHDILLNIADIFDVSVDYLLGKTEVKNYNNPYDTKLEEVLFSKAKDLTESEKQTILNVINAIKKNADNE